MSRDSIPAAPHQRKQQTLERNTKPPPCSRKSTLLQLACKQKSPTIRFLRTKETTANNHRIPPSNRSKVKSSVQRGIRQRFLDTYPGFEPYIDEVLPKKAQLDAVKLYVLLHPCFFATSRGRENIPTE